jgi:hypothetical protein
MGGGCVCQVPLPDLKARSKASFGYVGAERICLHGKWLAVAYAIAVFGPDGTE